MATLTASERERLLYHLRRTAGAFCDALGGVTLAQWQFHSPEGGWSPAQIAEHIVVSESVIFARVNAFLATPPIAPRGDIAATDTRILEIVPRRDRKFEASAQMLPTGRFSTPADALAEFQHARARTTRYVERTADDLRAHAGEHEILKTLDCYQWLLLAAAHTDRHLAQWSELRAHPQYPPMAATRHA